MAYHVCPDCEGKGTKDNLGSFTSDDLDEWYGDSSERDDFVESYRNGAYDKPCSYCDGQRVVDDEKMEGWADEVEYRNEVAAEQRMGA